MRATGTVTPHAASAVVLRFPTADLPRVVQQGRRGRHPRGVTALCQARRAREAAERDLGFRLLQLSGARDRFLVARREHDLRISAAQEALRAAQTVSSALDAELAQIDAEIATLVRACCARST